MEREGQAKQAAFDRYGNNGNESQYMLGKIQAFIVGARYADAHPNENRIHWQTGEPTMFGDYLVSTIGGEVKMVGRIEFSKGWRWLGVDDKDVTAWCKLSDIEPYKEEQP